MCFIVCVLFLFLCLMIGKTFVMFGYANKEFEFEYMHPSATMRQTSFSGSVVFTVFVFRISKTLFIHW